MKKYFRRLAETQIWMVVAGISLGYLARMVWGPPVEQGEPSREFNQALVESPDEFTDLPIIRPSGQSQ